MPELQWRTKKPEPWRVDTNLSCRLLLRVETTARSGVRRKGAVPSATGRTRASTGTASPSLSPTSARTAWSLGAHIPDCSSAPTHRTSSSACTLARRPRRSEFLSYHHSEGKTCAMMRKAMQVPTMDARRERRKVLIIDGPHCRRASRASGGSEV